MSLSNDKGCICESCIHDGECCIGTFIAFCDAEGKCDHFQPLSTTAKGNLPSEN